VPRLLFLTLLFWLPGLAAVELRGVRVGAHPEHLRVVLDLDGAADYRLDARADGQHLAITLPQTHSRGGALAHLPPLPAPIRDIQVQTASDGALTVSILLDHAVTPNHFQLRPSGGRGPRVVIDLPRARLAPPPSTLPDTRPASPVETRSAAVAATSPASSTPAQAPLGSSLSTGQAQPPSPAKSTGPAALAPVRVSDHPGAPSPGKGGSPPGPPVLRAADQEFGDMDLPPKARNALTDTLSYGGDVEVEINVEKDFDLDNGTADDLSFFTPQLELSFSFRPVRDVETFLNFALERDFVMREDAERRGRQTELNVKQLWLGWSDILPGFSMRVGRQRNEDPREWFYDEELDGLNLFYGAKSFGLEASVNRRNLVDRDLFNRTVNRNINNYFLSGWAMPVDDVEILGYLLVRDDLNKRRGTPVFFGAQLLGELDGGTNYWADAALVRGRDDYNRRKRDQDTLRGHGFDLGASVPFDLFLKPSITVAYAYGTGDSDPRDGTQREFRQTGLQDNNARFSGVTSLKYYGELFDPELSNMSIFTLGLGVRPSRRTSIDLVFHRYWQRRLSDDSRSIGIDVDPDGISRELGHEVDLVVGFREVNDFTAELVLAYFFPGNAFPRDADRAFSSELLLRRRF
jgi:alginate production protein